MPTSAPAATDAVQVSTPAPVFDVVPKVQAEMRLKVELSCVVGLEDHAAANPESLPGPRWSETIRQIVLQVERPATGVVDLPMTCSCCGKKLTLRVSSGLFLFAMVTFAMGSLTTFSAVFCMLLALAGLSAISLGIWLSINRPEKFDHFRSAVKIADDTRRDQELQRFDARNQHGILGVTRSDRPAS
jgi:hypothetical protein